MALWCHMKMSAKSASGLFFLSGFDVSVLIMRLAIDDWRVFSCLGGFRLLNSNVEPSVSGEWIGSAG